MSSAQNVVNYVPTSGHSIERNNPLKLKGSTIAVPIGALIGLVLVVGLFGATGMNAILGTLIGGMIGGFIGLYFSKKEPGQP